MFLAGGSCSWGFCDTVLVGGLGWYCVLLLGGLVVRLRVWFGVLDGAVSW